jgi:hypothetical protein
MIATMAEDPAPPRDWRFRRDLREPWCTTFGVRPDTLLRISMTPLSELISIIAKDLVRLAVLNPS